MKSNICYFPWLFGVGLTTLGLTSPLRAEVTDPAVKLDPMVVTGTLVERPMFDSPVRVQLVVSQSIVAVGARNLGDAIELLPGVRTESDCQNCNESNIRLCGLERGYVSVLFDGQP